MRRLAIACLVLLSLTPRAFATLLLGPTGRYLVDEAGRPVLLVGDAAWSLIAQTSLAEATLYLQDRAGKRFNAVLISLIEHAFCEDPPTNFYGQPPFDGPPFVAPNEAYFAHADAVLDVAAAHGMTVLLAPTYLGYQCGEQGWCAEIAAASQSQLRQWGNYLGWRYGERDNVIWLIGGDADPSPLRAQLREVVAGIREFDAGHFISAHGEPGSTARKSWPGESWLQLDNLYAYGSAIYVDGREAYESNPVLPFFLIESHYENEGGVTLQELRAQSYWAVLSGGFGHVFGSCPVWNFGYPSSWCGSSDWQTQLDRQGSLSMMYFGKLFRTRPWEMLVPDFAHTVVTDGYGTWASSDYVTAAATSDHTSIIAYLPTARTITVDTGTLAGSTVRVWWYDPATGFAQSPGTIPRGQGPLTPPGAGDWVLVLDDAGLGWPPPGLEPTTEAVAIGDDMVFPHVANEPNPFSKETKVVYRLDRATPVRVAVYDVMGSLVRVLFAGTQLAGRHALTWDGRGANGQPASSGVYFCRLETGTETATRRVLLLR